MTQHFEVIGDDEDEYDDEDVEGAIMGYAGPMGDWEGEEVEGQVLGYDEYGEPVVVGARGRRGRRRRRRGVSRIAVRRPTWRGRQLAPGVIAPDQGMLPLPLAGTPSSTFDVNINAITFEGQIQKPFRGERLLVSTVRTGTTAVGRLIAQLFVGTDLNQLDVPGFDAEQIGDPNAFGVRLAMKPAQPGVFIRLVTTLSTPLTTTDTIFATVSILGRNIH